MNKGFVGLFIVALLSMLPLSAAQAAPRQRCFAETNNCVSGAILDYWERNGGLPVFGYPITPLQTETIEGTWTGPTQWFERDRLEDHSANGEGVLAGRLGARYLELSGRPWAFGPGASAGAGCVAFSQTGHSTCGKFREYWERNGGLERFGYPISPAMDEIIEGKTYSVQYFERRRMEYHPENAGTPYEVLLGLLGNDVAKLQPCGQLNDYGLQQVVARYVASFGCPTQNKLEFQSAAYQKFDNGWMFWVAGTSNAPAMIFAVYDEGPHYRSEVFFDPYKEGDTVGGNQAPPTGKIAPVRGFGKVWWGNEKLRKSLGWAIEPETPDTGSAVMYNNGTWMLHMYTFHNVFVIPSGGYASVEMINE